MMSEALGGIRSLEEARNRDREIIRGLEEDLAEAKRTAEDAIRREKHLVSSVESMAEQLGTREKLRDQFDKAQETMRTLRFRLEKERGMNMAFQSLPKLLESGQRVLEDVDGALSRLETELQ